MWDGATTSRTFRIFNCRNYETNEMRTSNRETPNSVEKTLQHFVGYHYTNYGHKNMLDNI